ncbi:MAG: hypothetical protein AAF449_12330 [Myxococcota bacterium]
MKISAALLLLFAFACSPLVRDRPPTPRTVEIKLESVTADLSPKAQADLTRAERLAQAVQMADLMEQSRVDLNAEWSSVEIDAPPVMVDAVMVDLPEISGIRPQTLVQVTKRGSAGVDDLVRAEAGI